MGDISLRVIATQPATAGMFRLDQLVAAVARERLWITDAYFIGASPYMQALVAAAGDGVDVRLLVPGSSTDLPLVQNMTRAGYRQLLEAGIRIFEWNGTMVHAKTAVADGKWGRVGSSNLNIQSWLGNWELDVAVERPGVCATRWRRCSSTTSTMRRRSSYTNARFRPLGPEPRRSAVAGGGAPSRAPGGHVAPRPPAPCGWDALSAPH